MSESSQHSQTDFLYTLASNGRFERILRYVGSNDAVAVRRGAAGILTEFADAIRTDASDEFRRQLVESVLVEADDTTRARAVETLLYLDETVIDTLVTKIESDEEPTPTESPHPLLLVEWLGSEHAELRLLAVAGLGRVGTPHVIPKVKAACSDPNRRVRIRAIRECGRIGDETCVDAVRSALDSDDLEICKASADALAGIGTRAARHALLSAAKHSRIELRRHIVAQLGSLGSVEVLDVLVDSLAEDDAELREAAAASIVELVAAASFEESHTVREQVVESLADSSARDITPEFVELFETTHRTTIRRNTAWLLGEITETTGVATDCLLEALAAEDTKTALIAAASLARIGGRAFTDRLETYIDNQPEASPQKTRAQFVLEQITGSQADQILKDTVEYIFVSKPEDYTKQKTAED